MRKIILTIFMLFTAGICSAQLKVQSLLTENMVNPLSIGTQSPRFSWKLVESDKQNIMQTAYEVKVAEGNHAVWGSGKVMSDQSIFVRYAGKPFESNKEYTWQVRVWDNKGQVSEWANASFGTALLKPADWTASWISSGLKTDTVNGIVPIFRKSFSVSQKIASAKVFITSKGLYDVQINGKRVGDAYLAPGWTSYNKHLQFQTYDVSNLLLQGKNAVGILLGSGWYRTRLSWKPNENVYGKETALLFQLVIKYADGTTATVGSDGSWKVSNSAIMASEIYDGEIQDARLEKKNYSQANFDDSQWANAITKDFSKDYITAAINEPIRKHETFKPQRVLTSPKGETILDFGQNLVGWVKFSVSGKAGDRIKLSHVEMLDKEGSPYLLNLRTAKAQAIYTLSGNGTETFEPHFTFFGFRYVKVEGLSGKINPEDFTAVALYSDIKPSGHFECSNPLVNQLQHNIQWGQRGNFLDVPTDCPQRDERLGWTGDAEVFSRTAAYNFNVNQFFAKWLKDLALDQNENGSVPHVIPNVMKGILNSNGAAGWADASVIIPYNMYVCYGDKQIIENQYASMKGYLNFIRGLAKNDLWSTGYQWGDWLSYREDESKRSTGSRSAITDNYLVAQCFYAYTVQIMIKTAALLGKKDEVIEYEALLGRVKKAFQKEYMTPSGRLISETQTAYVLALQFDMLPEELRPQAVDRLVDNIKSFKYHLTTGFLGTPFLNPVLSRFGKSDIAYNLLLQDTYPSWLYPIKAHGATTIWERWDSMKPDSTFQSPGMTSFNHYAYGAVGDWMYRTIAGIDTKEGDGAGYKQIIIKPTLGGELQNTSAYYETGYGKVSSHWALTGGSLNMDITIPANTTATIYVPVKANSTVTQNAKPLNNKVSNNYMPVKVGSGIYHFTSSGY